MQADGTVVMENGILQIVVNKDGTLASLYLIDAGRYCRATWLHFILL